MVVAMYKKMIMSVVPDNLKEQLAKEKGTVKDGVIYLALASVVAIIMGIIGMVAATSLSMIGGSPNSMAMMGGSLIAGIVMIVILVPLIMIVGSLIGTYIMYMIAKALGGTGSFDQQFYHMAVMGGGITVISSLFSIIPCVGDLVQLVAWVFSLYLGYLIYMSVHRVSSGKAILLTLLPTIIGVVLAVLLIIIFGALIATMIGGFAGAGALAGAGGF